MGYPAVLVSLDLNLFSTLAEKPLTVPEICDALGIASRPATFNIIMLLFVEGQQYSGKELSEMLLEAGFADIEVKPAFGYWGIVTGHKP